LHFLLFTGLLRRSTPHKEQTLFRHCERQLRNPGLLSYPFLDGLLRRFASRNDGHKLVLSFKFRRRAEKQSNVFS